MAFLRTSFAQDIVPIVRGGALYLRPPMTSDYSDWAELRAASREHLKPFEPTWPRDDLTRGAFRRRIRHYQKELRDDLGVSFFIFRQDDDALIGGVTLSNIRRGVTQAVSLGYWTGRPFVRQGHMTRAVSLVVGFAFDDLRLHRIEAACLPNNAASVRVLERNGFQREGIARRYLRINGEWQDHLQFALLWEDARPAVELA
ncbi:MAG TPA: GNAT family protein [Hyphomicrobiaceae bacterium]|nr:GNAT family protein [Hyphomicrobiaceae bacterium]